MRTQRRWDLLNEAARRSACSTRNGSQCLKLAKEIERSSPQGEVSVWIRKMICRLDKELQTFKKDLCGGG
jgi:hypothetical protein